MVDFYVGEGVDDGADLGVEGVGVFEGILGWAQQAFLPLQQRTLRVHNLLRCPQLVQIYRSQLQFIINQISRCFLLLLPILPTRQSLTQPLQSRHPLPRSTVLFEREVAFSRLIVLSVIRTFGDTAPL